MSNKLRGVAYARITLSSKGVDDRHGPESGKSKAENGIDVK